MDLITLALLKKLIEANNTIEYYDSEDKLPEHGEVNKLYKAGDALYEWNGTEYVLLTVNSKVLATLERQIQALKGAEVLIPNEFGGLILKQPGSFGSSGGQYPQSIVEELGGVGFGAENEVHSPNGFAAGHGNFLYQYDAASVGAGNIVGDSDKWYLFKDVLDSDLLGVKSGKTKNDIVGRIEWLKEGDSENNDESNWNEFRKDWNELPGNTRQIEQKQWANFQHIHKASFGFAAGTSNIVKGRAGAVFGTHNTVTGENALGFGLYNTVSGHNSIVGGSYNLNTGGFSFVFGQDCKNEYNYVTITGRGCIAGRDNQRVAGQFNVVDNSAVDIVGWGASSNHRNNIYTLSQYGDARFGGKVTANNGFVSPSGTNVEINDFGDINARGVVYARNAFLSTLDADSSGQMLITTNYVRYRYVKIANTTSTPDANKVVQRDANGCAQFNNPINNKDAANKKYVDDGFNSIENILDEIIADQTLMIGGMYA